MRTRSIQGPNIAMSPIIIKYWNSKNVLLRTESYGLGYKNRLSRMTDEDKAPLADNPCDHWVIEYDTPAFGHAKRAWHPKHSLYVDINPATDQTSKPEVWPTQWPDIDWGPAMDELERNASGNMSTSVNMVVNAAEVIELKALAKGVIQSFKALTRKWWIYDSRVRKALKGRRRKGKRASLPSLQELADGHLAYSFGAAPLIRDIASFLEINQKIRDRRQELRDRSNRTVRLTARTTSQLEYETKDVATGNANDWPKVNRTFSTWVKGVGVVSADCTAFYNVDNPSTRWKHVSQALGLTSPLTSIWNLIPFSFVADWFLPIGKAIKKVEQAGWDLVDESAVTTDYSLFNYIHSTKMTWVTVLECRVGSTAVPSWSNLLLSTITQRGSHYVRSLGMPSVAQWWPDQSSDWSVSRTALSVSLSLQRLRQTPKPKPKKWPTLNQIYTKATRAGRR